MYLKKKTFSDIFRNGFHRNLNYKYIFLTSLDILVLKKYLMKKNPTSSPFPIWKDMPFCLSFQTHFQYQLTSDTKLYSLTQLKLSGAFYIVAF